jgi:hypothetical protein
VERKTLGIPNYSLEEKMLGILYSETIEANSRNSVPNHSAKEKYARKLLYHGTKIEAISRNSEPFLGRENNSEFRSVEQK